MALPPKRRGTRTERGYDNRWLRARKRFLVAHPLCRYCQQVGHTTPATVVDHIVPHRGDQALFWDEANWQPLCKTCHDSVKAQQERGGVLRGCDANGWPLDAGHHWNRPPEHSAPEQRGPPVFPGRGKGG